MKVRHFLLAIAFIFALGLISFSLSFEPKAFLNPSVGLNLYQDNYTIEFNDVDDNSVVKTMTGTFTAVDNPLLGADFPKPYDLDFDTRFGVGTQIYMVETVQDALANATFTYQMPKSSIHLIYDPFHPVAYRYIIKVRKVSASVASPSTTAPSTTAPSTTASSTTALSTTAPSTTIPSTTAPSTSDSGGTTSVGSRDGRSVRTVTSKKSMSIRQGWILENDGWYYYSGTTRDTLKKGWHLDPQDGFWYYLDLKNGVMIKGWHMIENKWYFFNEHTPMWTWELRSDGEWYYKEITNARPLGSMYRNEMTPDNYRVNDLGEYVE